MVYQGSKRKLAKDLKPIIESYLKPGMVYVEPFVGGANMIDKIEWDNKYGFDINPYLIALHQYAQQNELPFLPYDKETWTKMREHFKKQDTVYEDWVYGYYGFLCSFCGKFWDGWGNTLNKDEDYCSERIRNVNKQRLQDQYQNIKFGVCSYKDLDLNNCVVYCDPPYANTREYNLTGFKDKEEFEKVVEKWYNNNCVVLLSEQNPPSDKWKEIWHKEHKYMLGYMKAEKKIEKLFIYVGE